MAFDEYARSDTKVITLAVASIAVVCFALGYMAGSQLPVDVGTHLDSGHSWIWNHRLKSSMGDQQTKRLLATSTLTRSSDGISLLTPNIYIYNEYTYVKPLAGTARLFLIPMYTSTNTSSHLDSYSIASPVTSAFTSPLIR